MVAYRRDAKFASVKMFVVSEALAKPTSLFVFENKSLAHSHECTSDFHYYEASIYLIISFFPFLITIAPGCGFLQIVPSRLYILSSPRVQS